MSYARVQPLLPLTSIDTLMGLDPDDDWKKQTRVQTTSSIHRIPSAKAIVASSVVASPRHVPVVKKVALNGRQSPTVASFRTKAARKMAWPVFLCGFVAGIFGGMALLKSPVGQKPAVQHVVKQASSMMRSFR
ncbi:MAG: hypothetical protein U0270_01230 [Labilithrix sp.]